VGQRVKIYLAQLIPRPPLPLTTQNITMPLPYDLCARLQNAFRARQARISVPHTTQNLGILSILLRAGFLTNITRGTIEAPSPAEFLEAGEAQRRIWADLKYRNDRPVLENMHLVSKPSKRVFMDINEIRRLCTGRSAKTVKPLGMGEIAVVHTGNKEFEWLEAREAIQLRLDGEVICRAS
jgi:ribosomal protein S8